MPNFSGQRKVERRTGVVESFNSKLGQAGAHIRVDGILYHVPVSQRGILQEDGKSIIHCANGDKYHEIDAGTHAVIYLVYDADDKNPIPGLWAPKLNVKAVS